MKDRIPITLTEEQGLLYRESPTFKAGVDAFLLGVVPHFLEGLAQHAVRHDADIRARIAAAINQGETR